MKRHLFVSAVLLTCLATEMRANTVTGVAMGDTGSAPETVMQSSTKEEKSVSLEVGDKYADFAMVDTCGKAMKVSDFVGKNRYVLVDFWASWCGPCRREMPYVVTAYDKFHSKGLEVVGVSLDNNHDAWVKAISALNLTWPQMSDLLGWQCKGAKIYNVRGIPSNVLIDKKGRIVAKDLRGQNLIDELQRLMK